MIPWFQIAPTQLDALRATLRARYPTLHVYVCGQRVIVRGTLPIVNDDVAIDRYSIEIVLPSRYPHEVPSVWETEGRIPRVLDRHVYPSTGALCLGFPAELWIRLNGDFCVATFIEKAVRPYLIGNSLLEEGEPWPYGESSHGLAGGLEFYQRFLGTSDPRTIGRFLVDLRRGKVRGHWTCPCGSGRILRKCHGDEARLLGSLPDGIVKHSLDVMVSALKAASQGVAGAQKGGSSPAAA